MSDIHERAHPIKCPCELCQAIADFDAATDADGQWFEAQPERTDLVGPTTPGEIYLQCLRNGWETDPPRPRQWFTLVQQVMPGEMFKYIIPTLRCPPIFFCDEESAREVLENLI